MGKHVAIASAWTGRREWVAEQIVGSTFAASEFGDRVTWAVGSGSDTGPGRHREALTLYSYKPVSDRVLVGMDAPGIRANYIEYVDL